MFEKVSTVLGNTLEGETIQCSVHPLARQLGIVEPSNSSHKGEKEGEKS